MSRYIDADAFLKEYCEPYPHVYMAMSRAMADAPIIDIVRCKECRYKDMELCAMYKLVVAGVRKYDDFCSYGERKDNGKDIQSATE